MTTRAGYHHGNLREALVDAAVTLATQDGPDGVVMRAVTRQVGVSPNAAYRHFADRDALLGAVAHRAMRGLVTAMSRRQALVPDDEDARRRAVERLEATGRGYVDFALAEPGLFRVAFAAPIGTTLEPETHDPDADALGVLSRALDDLVDVGWIHPDRRPGAEVLCWSAVHGFAVLHLDGPLAGTPAADREASLSAALAHVSRGLGPG